MGKMGPPRLHHCSRHPALTLLLVRIPLPQRFLPSLTGVADASTVDAAVATVCNQDMAPDGLRVRHPRDTTHHHTLDTTIKHTIPATANPLAFTTTLKRHHTAHPSTSNTRATRSIATRDTTVRKLASSFNHLPLRMRPHVEMNPCTRHPKARHPTRTSMAMES